MTKQTMIISQIILVVVLLSGYSLWRFPDLRENLHRTYVLATTVIPENLTELYFENHLDLPKVIPTTDKASFAFTIHNLENKHVNYEYIIYAKRDTGETILTKGNIESEHDGYKTINFELPSLENLRTRIVIQLTGETSQEIAFWMEPHL